MKIFGLILFIFLQKCSGFDLDDVEYDKMPPLFSLDDYDRCLLYNGTYCVIRTDLFAEPDNELMTLMINYSKSSKVKHYNHTYQNKGVCLTTTCKDFIRDRDLKSQSDLIEILNECENHTIYQNYGLQAKVSKNFYCDTSETKVEKKDLLDWIVLALFIIILLVNIAGTAYDLILNETSKAKLSIGKKMILCFSIPRNWNFLFAPPSTDPKIVKLQGISFIRASGSFIMVLGHVVWIFTMGFIDNPHEFERSYEKLHFQVIYNGMIVVQIFFVMSGFLLIYNLEAAAEDKKISLRALPIIALHRFCRLAPPLAIVLALNSTWVRFLGSGPLWKLYVSSMIRDCRKWWWSHLLFINNYLTDNVYCTVQTWHTAADTHVFFVAITLYLLVKPRARGLVATVFFIIGMILPALHVYFQDLDAQFLKTPEMLRSLDDPNRYPYVFSHNNICSFLIGMVTAHKIYQWQKQGVMIKGKIAKLALQMFFPVFILCFISGNLFHEEDYRTPLWIRMLWQGTHRIFIGFTIACCLTAMVMGVNTIISDVMKWPMFRVAGKLTYSVFLLHETFTPLVAGSKSNLEHFSYLNLLIYQCGIVVLTYIISTPFYLMIEAPVTPLLKLILIQARSDDTSIVVPDPTKNFIADVIQHKRKQAIKTTKKTENKEVLLNGKERKNNALNELLENAAREDIKEKAS